MREQKEPQSQDGPVDALILHPDLSDPGGVADYYRKVSNKFTLPVAHHVVGSRPREAGIFSRVFRLASDYRTFLKVLKTNRYQVVHINPVFWRIAAGRHFVFRKHQVLAS